MEGNIEAERTAALQSLFGSDVEVPEVLEACIKMCKIFNKAPEELFYEAEAVKFNTKAVRFDIAQAKRLHDTLKKGLTAGSSKSQVNTPMKKGSMTPKTATTKSAFGQRFLAGDPSGTPSTTRKNPALTRVTASGTTLGSPGPKSTLTSSPALTLVDPLSQPSGSKFRILPRVGTADFSYRYMFEKLQEKANALDNRIDEFGQYVREYYNINDDLGDPSAETEDDVIVVGRIVDSTDSKLTEASLMLESSRWMGSGKRVPLRFAPNLRLYPDQSQKLAQPCQGIGLFPGAIVALKGAKAHGYEGGFFMAKEILPLPPLKPSSSRTGKEPELSFSAIVASGPYTFDKDLDYTPFTSLLAEVAKHKPSSLILLGPFIDANHPLIKDGDVDVSLTRIFVEKIAKPLQDLLKSLPDMSCGIVPSVKDLASPRNVFPQGAFIGPQTFQDWPRITILSNPCIFSISGVSFGITSVDVLFHLRKLEVYKPTASTANNPNPDPMAGLCRHLLDQRSFYPLFPVPKDLSSEVNLDITHSHLLSLDNSSIPNVLILPSRLKEFSKVVDGTVIINPSTTSRFSSDGLFSKITVDAMRQGPERIAVDLIKL